MKKDGIQTRNRKLATKAKRRKSLMTDFFKPFDSRSFSAMYSSMGSSYLAAAAAGNPAMSQYYGQMGAMSAMQPFMGTSSPSSSAAAAMPPSVHSPPTPSAAGMDPAAAAGLYHSPNPYAASVDLKSASNSSLSENGAAVPAAPGGEDNPNSMIGASA